MDLGSKYTDTQIQKLERRIRSVYREAQRDIDSKIKDFNSRFETKNKIQLEKVKKGEITDDDYKRWLSGQVFQGERWKAKRQEIAEVLYEANSKAVQITNGQKANVFAFNSNYQAYRLEHSAGVNFGFDLYDSATVVNLIKNEPNLLPKMSERVKKSIDVPWNTKKITRQITQGIIQGEKLDDVAKRLSKVTDQDWKFMRTHARTAMTGAQNAGRQQRLNEAQNMGIRVHKEWMATLDGRTRYTHRGLDGQKKPMSEPFEIDGYSIMFPGDPEAHPSMVYNCRCTMVGDIDGYPSEYERYDNIDGFPIRNMTYREWEKAKFGKEHRSANNFVWNKRYVGIPNREYGNADTSDAVQEILSGKSNSLIGYLDENGNLLPERAALHKQIIDNYLSGKTPEEGTPIMTMMGGGPASGKSSVIRSGLYQLPNMDHSITIDPDDIKQHLPGYLKMSKTDSTAASFYHEESSMLAKQLASTCFTENFNVTYDGTGDGSVGSVMKKLNGAKKYGYQVNGMYVTVDIDEALKRNKSRYDHAVAKGESPRLVPDTYVIDCHKKVTRISMEVSDQFDNIELYDNNGKSGETKLIATGGSGKKLEAIKGEESAFEKFISKGE